MLLISMFVIERRTIERPNFNAFPGSRLKNMTFSLLILAAVCLSSLLHDLSYRELTDRSFMLNNKFATTASALDLYDLSEAQQVRIPRHVLIEAV